MCATLGLLSFVLSGIGQVYAFLGVLLGTGLVLFALTRGWSGAEVASALTPGSYEPEPSDRDEADPPA